MRKLVINLLIFCFFICCPGASPVFAWEESSSANLLIFDDQGEVSASYHLDNWTIAVSEADSLIYHQIWQTGSPPLLISEEKTSFTVNSNEVAVPNVIKGASTAPATGVPGVSMYTFDEAIFTSLNPTGTPGLSVSQPSGVYDATLALEFTTHLWPGAPKGFRYIEVLEQGQWVRYNSPHTVYLVESADLQVRGVYVQIFGGTYVTQKSFSYTIIHPEGWNKDSDGDGFPDAWEAAHNLNPLSGARTDSDSDGISDIDEVLRGSDPNDANSLPTDTDGDGWSDWDEIIRGTAVSNPGSYPTATRLYEVEILLSGLFSGGPGSWASAPYFIETLGGQILTSGVAKLTGAYGVARIPMGREAFIRGVQPHDTDGDGDTDSDDSHVVAISRYLPMIADPSPADVTGTWTTPADWQALFEQFLHDTLVVPRAGYNVDPTHRAELALLARALELEAQLGPEAWFGFGSFGHRPAQPAIDAFTVRLGQDGRNINDVVTDISAVLDSGCNTLRSDIAALAAAVPPEGVEAATALYLHTQPGSYTAALLAHYSSGQLAELGTLCEVLNPNNDADNDTLPAAAEISLDSSSTDPFNHDSDNDGVADPLDNCPAVANFNQKDSDGDGIGDVCDDDDDNDGLTDGTEMAFGSNPFNVDTDNDGIPDGQEWVNGTHPGVSVYVTGINTPTNLPSQIVTGYRYPGAAVYVSVSADAVRGPCSLPSPASWSCEISNLVEEKNYVLSLQASFGGKWGYGNATISVDLTPPVVSISSPLEGAVIPVNNPILVYTAAEGYVDISIDGNPVILNSGENMPPLGEGSHSVRVEATDAAGNTGYDQVSFTVTADEAPVADAGTDKLVEPYAFVRLDGSGSYDNDGIITAYNWIQMDGVAVTLYNASTATPDFDAPFVAAAQEESLMFRLTVTDNAGQTAIDDVLITVVKTDMDEDGDVDGADLAEIINQVMTPHRLEALVERFGTVQQ